MDNDTKIIILTIVYVGTLIWIPALKLDILYGIISSIVYFMIGLILLYKRKTKENKME